NVPLLILGYFKFGKKFILPTLYAIVISSIFIDLMSLLLGPMTSDKLLAAVSGGALSGCGIGVVFRAGGTTGGTDIVVKVLKQKFRQLKTGILLFSVDSLIVASSAVVFGDIDVALYAAIGLVVSSIVVDIVLYGTDGAKLVFIVSDCPEKIALRLLSELDIGATYINGVGAFSNEKKCVLMVAIKKNMFYKLRDIITKDDQKAFMIVSSANEIFGEGFKAHNSEEL
ncbi:MAG: YitT family protein, partial [Clostridia bacterium]